MAKKTKDDKRARARARARTSARVTALAEREPSQEKEQRQEHEDRRGPFPWERQPGESGPAYRLFAAYRTAPASQRSIRKLGVSMQYAARLSRRHNWVARAMAWDDHVFELSDGLTNVAALGHRLKALRFGSVSLDKATEAAAKLKPETLTPQDIVVLAKSGTELGRQALELETRREQGETKIGVAVNIGAGGPAWLTGARTKVTSELSQSEVKANVTETERNLLVPYGEKVLGEILAAPVQRGEGSLADRIARESNHNGD